MPVSSYVPQMLSVQLNVELRESFEQGHQPNPATTVHIQYIIAHGCLKLVLTEVSYPFGITIHKYTLNNITKMYGKGKVIPVLNFQNKYIKSKVVPILN
jgi:hypothetical protein